MATNSSKADSKSPKNILISEEVPLRKLYFINEKVEWDLTQYIWTGCTRVELRDSIMSNAYELIRQIIRKQGLHTIYPGQEESAFGDLLQTAWCLVPGTLVFTEKGLMPIELLANHEQEGEVDIKVYGRDGLNTAEYWARRPATATRKIKLAQHYNIEGTYEHPLLVMSHDGPVYKNIGDISIDDLVSVQANQQVFGDQDRIDIAPVQKATYDWWPEEFTEDLAYIIGLIISEGSIERGRVTINYTNQQVIDFLSTSPAGLPFRHEGEGRNVCNQIKLVELLTHLGLPPGTTFKDKYIPERMFLCSKKIIVAMLQGMFDGGGYSSEHNGEVGYSSCSERLIDQLRILMLNFGIYTNTIIAERGEVVSSKGSAHTASTAYQLKVSTLDSRVFYEQIGFRISCKQEKERLINNTYTKLVENLSIDDNFLQERRQEIGIVRWFPVSDITEGMSETYDIRVRDVHNFTANGIITHNCQLERTLYKYRSRPHCRACFNLERPAESVLYTPQEYEYGIISIEDLLERTSTCPNCNASLTAYPIIAPRQGLFGGTDTIIYRGMSKVFNMWSQISRTVILAYIKKEGRDRKNGPSYVNYLGSRNRPLSDVMERFFNEARQLAKYNEDHLRIINALEKLYINDERPHDGLIGKLVDEANLPRLTVTNFLKLMKLQSYEFTDSPINKGSGENKTDRKKAIFDEEDS